MRVYSYILIRSWVEKQKLRNPISQILSRIAIYLCPRPYHRRSSAERCFLMRVCNAVKLGGCSGEDCHRSELALKRGYPIAWLFHLALPSSSLLLWLSAHLAMSPSTFQWTPTLLLSGLSSLVSQGRYLDYAAEVLCSKLKQLILIPPSQLPFSILEFMERPQLLALSCRDFSPRYWVIFGT